MLSLEFLGSRWGMWALEIGRSRIKCFLANRSMYVYCNTRSDACYRTPQHLLKIPLYLQKYHMKTWENIPLAWVLSDSSVFSITGI